MFSKILQANDGSEHAFNALSLALLIAKQNESELHMVSVEEIDYMPEFIEEVRQETGAASRRFHAVIQRARKNGERDATSNCMTHALAGHPVRDIVELACDLSRSDSARHRRHRPFGFL